MFRCLAASAFAIALRAYLVDSPIGAKRLYAMQPRYLFPHLVVGLGHRGKIDVGPSFDADVLHLLQHHAGKFLLMTPGLNENNPGSGLQAGMQIVEIPVPDRLSNSAAFGVLAALDRVIDDYQIGAPARDGAPDAGREILSRIG